MNITNIVLYFQIIFRVFASGTTCVGQKPLVKASSIDTSNATGYIRHLSCQIFSSQIMLYRCKMECLRQEDCRAIRYNSACELCSYANDCYSGDDLDLDHLYVNPYIGKIRFFPSILVSYFYS